MVTVLIPQLTMHNTSYETIEIITFQARIEWLHITIVILYTCALISTSAKYIHWVKNAFNQTLFRKFFTNTQNTSILYL